MGNHLQIEYIGTLAEELSDIRKKELASLTIKELEIIEQPNDEEWYEDDHCLCVDVKLKLSDGSELTTAFMWIGPDFLADIFYARKGNKEALKSVTENFKSYIEAE